MHYIILRYCHLMKLISLSSLEMDTDHCTDTCLEDSSSITMNQIDGDLNDSGTSFDMVLMMVPALRSRCALILNNSARNILGVKLLRLVSRQASEVMVKDVQGYTLELRSGFSWASMPPSLAMVLSPKAWRYLRNSELRKLRVLVHEDMPARKGKTFEFSMAKKNKKTNSQWQHS